MPKREEPPEPPTNEALSMKKKGVERDDVRDTLKSKGYSPQQISEAMNQADIKNSIDEPPAPPTGDMESSALDQLEPSPEYEENTGIPSPDLQETQVSHQIAKTGREEIEEIAEAIIEEKWQQIVSSVGDLETWKARVEDDLTATKQEVLRLISRFNTLQNSIAGKITEYSEGIAEVGSEIKALEKVLQNIMSPLTTNVKELSKIVNEMKK